MKYLIAFFLLSIQVSHVAANNFDIYKLCNQSYSEDYKKSRKLEDLTSKKIAKYYDAIMAKDAKGLTSPNISLAREVLNDIEKSKDSLKSYDRSILWSSWAYIYFVEKNYESAIYMYDKVISEDEVALPVRNEAIKACNLIKQLLE